MPWIAVTGLTLVGVRILSDEIGPVIWSLAAGRGLHSGDLIGLGALAGAAVVAYYASCVRAPQGQGR
jgi:hypothetical protein